MPPTPRPRRSATTKRRGAFCSSARTLPERISIQSTRTRPWTTRSSAIFRRRTHRWSVALTQRKADFDTRSYGHRKLSKLLMSHPKWFDVRDLQDSKKVKEAQARVRARLERHRRVEAEVAKKAREEKQRELDERQAKVEAQKHRVAKAHEDCQAAGVGVDAWRCCYACA